MDVAQLGSEARASNRGLAHETEGVDEETMGFEPSEREPLLNQQPKHPSVLDSGSWDREDSVVIALERQGGAFNKFKAGILKAYNYLIRLHGSPEEVAWGLALGLFIAMSPTVGLQMLIAVPIATALRINSAAAAAGVWLTNPLTIPFLYGLNYYIGASILGYDMTFTIHGELTLGMLFSAGGGVWWSLIVGGVITGAAAALVSYYPTLFLVRAGRATLKKRLERRRARKAAKKAAKQKASTIPPEAP
jgi:uncharacterized protein (DUF2062 family)